MLSARARCLHQIRRIWPPFLGFSSSLISSSFAIVLIVMRSTMTPHASATTLGDSRDMLCFIIPIIQVFFNANAAVIKHLLIMTWRTETVLRRIHGLQGKRLGRPFNLRQRPLEVMLPLHVIVLHLKLRLLGLAHHWKLP